jgi:hypothetical protein
MAMDTLIKEEWADALLSGEYPRAGNVLARANAAGEPISFCCLGVLCELAIKHGVPIERMVPDNGDEGVLYGREGEWSEAYLPHAVIVWAGLQGHVLPDGDVRIRPEDLTMKPRLSELNDEGVAWDLIAKAIRDQL